MFSPCFFFYISMGCFVYFSLPYTHTEIHVEDNCWWFCWTQRQYTVKICYCKPRSPGMYFVFFLLVTVNDLEVIHIERSQTLKMPGPLNHHSHMVYWMTSFSYVISKMWHRRRLTIGYAFFQYWWTPIHYNMTTKPL